MVLKAFVDYNIKNSVCRALLQDCFWSGQISKPLPFVRHDAGTAGGCDRGSVERWSVERR
jgi:hypothetical protein